MISGSSGATEMAHGLGQNGRPDSLLRRDVVRMCTYMMYDGRMCHVCSYIHSQIHTHAGQGCTPKPKGHRSLGVAVTLTVLLSSGLSRLGTSCYLAKGHRE